MVIKSVIEIAPRGSVDSGIMSSGGRTDVVSASLLVCVLRSILRETETDTILFPNNKVILSM